MAFTVVRAVRAAETTTLEVSEALQGTALHAMPQRASAMDLPFAEQVIHLDFAGAAFATTVPGTLS
jgi:hypothetical protein